MKNPKRELWLFVVLIMLVIGASGCTVKVKNIKHKNPDGTVVTIRYENGAILERRPVFSNSGETVTMRFNGTAWYSVSILSAEEAAKFESIPAISRSSNVTAYENIASFDPEGFKYQLLCSLEDTDDAYLLFCTNDEPGGLKTMGSDYETCIRFFVDDKPVSADIDGLLPIPNVVQPTGALESELEIEPASSVPDAFIRGMDTSAVISLEDSGVKYYDFDGNEADVFKTLADSGVNYIRLRVWNDPYDADGNGYGGGNCDIEKACLLGKRATNQGMRVCIDFHYSDFWADPKRQLVPKAWEGMKLSEKADAVYAYTKECLEKLYAAGVDVQMVQIGNEINYGLCGETMFSKIAELLKAGCKAAREAAAAHDSQIRIVIHYTKIDEPGNLRALVSNLEAQHVDYDIIGLSYYPFWDGTIENMETVIPDIRSNFGKDVLIAETSYCYTSEDGDGSGNSFDGKTGLVEGYPATVQGQAKMIRDICEAACRAGALGVFYWEGTWIPVGSNAASNSKLWEKYGSGWASSFAAPYDPDDAGKYYGGCSWDNQAMFDFTGHPLESLKVFKLLRYGTKAKEEQKTTE